MCPILSYQNIATLTPVYIDGMKDLSYPERLCALKLLRVTSEYHSFHCMILRDHIHSIVSSEI